MGVFRCFAALELNDDVRLRLAEIQHRLRQAGAHVGWSAPRDFHLTLIFLGHVIEARIAELAVCLDRAASGHGPFSFQVSGLGHFGSPNAPRVLWAGVPQPPRELLDLQREVAKALEGGGDAEPEARPYAPHITLGRVKSSRGLGELTSTARALMNTPFGVVGVHRALLMRSHTDEPEARYSVLHASRLKGT